MSVEKSPNAPKGPEVYSRGQGPVPADDEVAAPQGEQPEAQAETAADAPVADEAAVPVEPPVPAPAVGTNLDDLLGSNSELLAEGEHTGDALTDPVFEDKAALAAAAEMNMDFAQMLAAAGGMSEFKAGDKVRGSIVSITHDTVFVDLGLKSEAFLDRREILDDDGNPKFALGDEIEAQVVQIRGEGVRLSTGALKAHQLSEMLADAAESGLAVEGHVTGFNDGGLEVRVGSRRAFCPKSQIDRGFTEDLASHVGVTYQFLVTRYDPTGRKIVVSRRALMEREAKEMAQETRRLLEEGAILEGTVRKVMPFGAFIDLGGVDGLVHVSELSWERVEDPKTVVKVGQPVRVKVLRIDTDRDRIGLSMKQAQGDPWLKASEEFEVGKTYEGTVTRLADFGAFVQLQPGLEGLVHVSEIDWSRIKHPRDALAVEDKVTVVILEVNVGRRRLSLSIKQVSGEDPFRKAVAGVTKGQRLEVTVEKVADFGVFCIVSEGVTGLIPNSHMNTPRGTNHCRMFKPGTKVDVMVIDTDARARKITLSRKALEEEGAQADYRAYKKQAAKEQADAGKTAFQLAWEAAQGK
jgi:small subunit ribosomal protein S1